MHGPHTTASRLEEILCFHLLASVTALASSRCLLLHLFGAIHSAIRRLGLGRVSRLSSAVHEAFGSGNVLVLEQVSSNSVSLSHMSWGMQESITGSTGTGTGPTGNTASRLQ